MSLSRRTIESSPATAALVLSAAVAGCAGEYPQTTFQPVTDFGTKLNDLLSLVFWLTIGILVIVLGILTFVVVRYRERPDASPPRKVYGNNLAEVLWTLGPAVIVAIIIVPTVRLIFDTYRPPEDDGETLVVDVVAHQWWWEYQYPGLDVITANELHLPVGRPIELRLWTADVLHSWWAPRIGGKRDTWPRATVEGEQTPNWHVLRFTIREPGAYLGQCAEYCGISHALMRTRVVAEPEEEFEAWVRRMKAPAGTPGRGAETPGRAAGTGPSAGTPGGPSAPPRAAERSAAGAAERGPATGPMQAAAVPTQPGGVPARPGAPSKDVRAAQDSGDLETAPAFADTLVQRGYRLFTTRACVACHTVAGTPAQGRIGPDLTLFGERWAVGVGTLDNTYENLVRWIENPSAIKPGAKMPGTRTPGGALPPTGLSPEQVRAVAAYLLSLR